MLADRLGSRSGSSQKATREWGAGGGRSANERPLGTGTAITVRRTMLLATVLAALTLWMATYPVAGFAQESEDLATLQIVTVPPTAGLPITIGTESYELDDQGILTVDLPEGVHVLTPPELFQPDESTRFLFRRWNDSWDRVRYLELKRDKTLTLGVIHQHPVSIAYTDYAGDPIDGDEIERADFVNDRGDWVTFPADTSELDGATGDTRQWLSANRLRRSGIGLLSVANEYTLANAVIRGQEAAQGGRYSFTLLPDGPSEWTVPLSVFPLKVEVASLLLGKSLDARVRLHELADPDGPALYEAETSEGTALFPQVPRGDYEVRVSGWLSRATPVILTGPKTERITVATPLLLAPIVPLVVLAGISLLLWRKPKYRIGVLFSWIGLAGLVAITPAIFSAAVAGDALSSTATPLYGSGGELIGITVEIDNESPVPISHTYCSPDFEMRVPLANSVWSGTYENPDFHDVELGECRITTLQPGVSQYVFASTPGQEWSVSGETLPPGDYTALIRIFGIPSPELAISNPSDFPTLVAAEELGEPRDVPFAPPEED